MEESTEQTGRVPGIMTSFTEEEKIEFARLIGKLQSELDEKISHEDDRIKMATDEDIDEMLNEVFGK